MRPIPYIDIIKLILDLCDSIYCTLLLIGVFATTCYWDLAPSNSLAASTGESLWRCWCDLNAGHLLSAREFGSNYTVSSIGNMTAQNVSALASIQKESENVVASWFAKQVERVSTRVTEEYLGFKVTL